MMMTLVSMVITAVGVVGFLPPTTTRPAFPLASPTVNFRHSKLPVYDGAVSLYTYSTDDCNNHHGLPSHNV